MRPRSVGVVVDAHRVPTWHRSAIELLTKEGLTVTVHSAPAAATSPRMPRLLRAILAWERRRSMRPPDALEWVGLAPPQKPLDCGHGLDLVVWLADAEIPAELARDCRFGIWYLTQGDARTQADCPLAREVRAGTGLVETALWTFDGETHRRLLVSIGTVDRFSYLRSLAQASAKAAHLPRRMVSAIDAWSPVGPKPVIAARPGQPRLAAVRLAARVALRVAVRSTQRRLFRERWMVAWRTVEESARDGAPAGDVRYRLVDSEEGHYYADPFPILHKGRRWLFFEDFSEATGRGSIAAVDISDGGRPQVRRVLDLDTHLSYPFLLGEGGETYMLPENRGSKRLELWRAADFPDRWERAWPLFNEFAVADGTLLRHDGRVWLFAAVAVDDGAPIDELCLFHAEDLKGPWMAHPLNPIVSDVRRARPAGPILSAGGTLVRPAQDCSRAYGWRTVFNRIDVLSPDDYRETPIAVATPVGWRARRTHAFARAGDVEAVDVLVARPRLATKAFRHRSNSVRIRFTPLP